SLPVNVKVLVEGEEEVGSRNLNAFFQEHKERIRSDVIVVCDTENIDAGVPSITYSLRGIVAVQVEVEGLELPVHSGMGGGMLPDAALALDVVLSRLYWKNGKLPIKRFYDRVRKMTGKERKALKKLPGNDAKWRKELGLLPKVKFATRKDTHPYEQTWRLPAVTVIAQEASSIQGASNQVLPNARAIVSARIPPHKRAEEAHKPQKAPPTKAPAGKRKSDGAAAGPAGELVDDRSQRPGVRGRLERHEDRLSARANPHRLR